MIEAKTLERFKEVFEGRTDAWGAVHGESVPEDITKQHFVHHLVGKTSLGIYPLLDDGRCRWGLADVDVDDLDLAIRLREALRDLGLNSGVYIERSKSKGYHVWLLFDALVSAKNVRRILRTGLTKAGLDPGTEIFPKQDSLDGETKLGNYVNLPYCGKNGEGKRCILRPDTFHPMPVEEFIDGLRTFPTSSLELVLEALPPEEKSERRNPPGWLGELMGKSIPTGQRRPTLTKIAGAYRAGGIDVEAAVIAVAAWAEKAFEEPLPVEKIEKTVRDIYERYGTRNIPTADDGPEPVMYRGPVPKLAPLLEGVRGYIRQYVVLTDSQADAITLWVAHTHAFDSVESTPYLSITSAEKRSGKTLLLEVLDLIVSRPWLTGRVSAAALYRRVHAERPTLLLDESDSAFKSGEEYAESLRGVLNTGYRRSGSTTVCVGQGANMSYGIFSTFAPKAIAGIGRLPDTVEDRSVSIVLRRKAPGETAARFKYRKAREEAASLKQGLEAWADHSESLVEAEPDLPEALDDRARDGWEVLLAIADLAGGGWPQRGRIAALALSVGDWREDESEGVLLLSHIRDIFAERGDPDKITSAQLIRDLNGMEEAPWGDLKGRSLDARGLAKRLRPFRIRSRQIRLSDTVTVKGYLGESFVPEWARYLPSRTPERAKQAKQAKQNPDIDTDDVSDVSDVSANTGMGEREDSGAAWTKEGQP